MTDGRQRLRREAVEWAEEAKGGRAGTSGQYVTGTYPGILAMESLLVEAEAEIELIEICEAANSELADRVKYADVTIAKQAKEIEELKEWQAWAREEGV